jgi:hypothetical protein
MATVNEVISDAFDEIGINISEESLSASDAQRAIRMLNDMMAVWEANGIDLDYTVVSNLSDEVTVVSGALMGVKKALAIYLAPSFKGEITDALVESTKDAMRAVKNIAITLEQVYPPTSLPIGSGNYNYNSSKFFPDMAS